MLGVTTATLLADSEPGTLAFYEIHCDAYWESTAHLDMEAIYAPFLAQLPPRARILDAGCGSGRDTKAFAARGLAVVAIDASPALAARARAFTGRPCIVTTFQRLACRDAFDGIWACASLVHVPKPEIRGVLHRFTRALRRGGVLYVSLKHGHGEGVDRDGRFVNAYTSATFREEIAAVSRLRHLASWITDDVRSPRSATRWLNVLLEKTDPAS